MLTIYRYPINDSSGFNKIKLPRNAEILYPGIATEPSDIEEGISLWAMVETEESPEERTFIVVGTGVNMDFMKTYNYKSLGIVRKSNRYAFHVFEVWD